MLTASINAYVNIPLHEFERTMSFSLIASSFLSAIQSVASLVDASSATTQAAQRNTFVKQMEKFEKAITQAEKDAIVSETALMIKAVAECIEEAETIAARAIGEEVVEARSAINAGIDRLGIVATQEAMEAAKIDNGRSRNVRGVQRWN